MTDEPRDELDELLARELRALTPEPDAATTLEALQPRFEQARRRRRAGIAATVTGGIAAAVVLVALAGTGTVDLGREVRTDPAHRPGGSTPRPGGPSTTTTTSTDGTTSTTAATVSTTTVAGGATTTSTTSGGGYPRVETVTSYGSAGGSVTVGFDGVTLRLVSTSPAAGYTTEIHTQRPDEIEVRFRGTDTEARIRLRVEDGRVDAEFSDD